MPLPPSFEGGGRPRLPEGVAPRTAPKWQSVSPRCLTLCRALTRPPKTRGSNAVPPSAHEILRSSFASALNDRRCALPVPILHHLQLLLSPSFRAQRGISRQSLGPVCTEPQKLSSPVPASCRSTCSHIHPFYRSAHFLPPNACAWAQPYPSYPAWAKVKAAGKNLRPWFGAANLI